MWTLLVAPLELMPLISLNESMAVLSGVHRAVPSMFLWVPLSGSSSTKNVTAKGGFMETEDAIQEALAQMDVQTRTLIAEVDLGHQAKEFFASDLGKYILGCITQEIQEAQMAMDNLPFWQFWRFRQLQNRIWRARAVVAWLADLVRSGRSAENALAEAGE